MVTCLCCSHQLLRHFRGTGIYWYCSHCRLEMPGVESSAQTVSLVSAAVEKKQVVNLNQWRKLPNVA